MNKEQFLDLNRKIGELPDDINIRKEFLLNEFKKMGFSIENGYKLVQYYYNEICKKRDGLESIFDGKLILQNDTFSFVNSYTCYFKMRFVNFDERKKIYFPDNIGTENKQIKGFQNKLTDEQIKSLYEQMQGNYFETSPENFKAIFKPISILDNFKKVVWLKHKTALREFFTLLNIIPTQKIVKGLICDEKGNEIVLPKAKKNEYSVYYAEMENFINSINTDF